MLHAEWIEYLKRENGSKYFDQIKNHYMPRKLKRFTQINRKILETTNDTFIIVHAEEDYNEQLRQMTATKSVHYLIESKNGANHLLWQKSSGSLSKLNEYVIKQEEDSIDEDNILSQNNDAILIISTVSGMGKSLLLDRLTQLSSAEHFFVKIVLNTCTRALSDLRSGKVQIQDNTAFDFVLNSLLGKKDEQEISLLKRLASSEKFILMFDGLDEVNEYREQIINLIDTLRQDENYKFKKILLTTRNHLKMELEEHFRTLAFNLNNFDDNDQQSFLYKYWRNLNLKHHKRATSAKLKQTAEDLIKKIKSILSENISQLIGIPLQTQILADIFFGQVKGKREDELSNLKIANIANLFNQFIETKIRIQYEEKNKRDVTIEKRQKMEREKKMFYSDHIKLASSILFEGSGGMVNLLF